MVRQPWQAKLDIFPAIRLCKKKFLYKYIWCSEFTSYTWLMLLFDVILLLISFKKNFQSIAVKEYLFDFYEMNFIYLVKRATQ